jgi:Holliday junction DNA helicase RuvA
MIQSLRGRVSGQKGNTLYLDQGPMEWAVEVSLRSLEELASADGTVKVYTYLHHREDQMRMYGFSREEERDLFLELIRVSGIGPKQALRILSGIPVEQLVAVIDNEEADRLSQVPGVGKKTAAKIILALRGKLMTAEQEKSDGRYPELVSALNEMGFEAKKAKQALIEVAGEIDADGMGESEFEHELFRRAIVYLSSGR